VLQEFKEQQVQVLPELQVQLDHKDLKDHKDLQDFLDHKVHADHKALLVPQDHKVPLVQTAQQVQQDRKDLKAPKEPPVLEHLEQSEPRVPQDLKDPQDYKDPLALVQPEQLALPVLLVQQDRKDLLGPLDPTVLLAQQDHKVQQDHKDPLALQDHKDLKDPLALQDHKDLKDPLDQTPLSMPHLSLLVLVPFVQCLLTVQEFWQHLQLMTTLVVLLLDFPIFLAVVH
jgi:hypothetical protein